MQKKTFNPQFKTRLTQLAEKINTTLKEIISTTSCPPQLKESMQYSLLAGGKRIRPILCLSWGKMLGLEEEKILPFACGLEFIHTYSLIHDDLPAMDNDDLRRGKPTNHKIYGEGMAILAGDALLTQSFELMLSTPLPPSYVLAATLEVSKAAGPKGMVGGQVLDLSLENQEDIQLNQIQEMHTLKTGALLTVSCLSGALLAQSKKEDAKALERAKTYGENFGLAFQIVDDILDLVGDEKTLGKPVGSDLKQGKSTYPSLIGLEKSYELAYKSIDRALLALASYQGEEKDFLVDIAKYIVARIN
ncbi:MAG: geranylgeranyl diphosphate synthase, type [Desulfonauticus sp.]|jgi:geranylgeranyl diphosphate synthase type II|nr:MAG: Polyprenyl synthetase [Desulfonauticus sp. 38_4375]MDK2920666.1 geranylgeranyl diphosphate synthase, type [Desulfonauticus sp.]